MADIDRDRLYEAMVAALPIDDTATVRAVIARAESDTLANARPDDAEPDTVWPDTSGPRPDA